MASEEGCPNRPFKKIADGLLREMMRDEKGFPELDREIKRLTLLYEKCMTGSRDVHCLSTCTSSVDPQKCGCWKKKFDFQNRAPHLIFRHFEIDISSTISDMLRTRASRISLPGFSVKIMKEFASEHTERYKPTEEELDELSIETGLRSEQIINWLHKYNTEGRHKEKQIATTPVRRYRQAEEILEAYWRSASHLWANDIPQRDIEKLAQQTHMKDAKIRNWFQRRTVFGVL